MEKKNVQLVDKKQKTIEQKEKESIEEIICNI